MMRKASIPFVLIAFCCLQQVSMAQMKNSSLARRPLGTMALAPADVPLNDTACQTITNDFKAFAATFGGAIPPADNPVIKPCLDFLNATFVASEEIPTVAKVLKKVEEVYSVTLTDDVTSLLVETHFLLKSLHKLQQCSSAPLSVPCTSIGTADHGVEALMDYFGLNQLIAGSLVGGPAFGQTGKLSQGTTSTGTTPTTSLTGTAASSANSTPNTLAHIEWQLKHFGDEKGWWLEPTVGGSFGIQPVVTLLKNPPPAASATGTTPAATTTATTAATAATTSQYQSAFVWNVDGRGNIPIGSINSEISTFARIGQVRLLTGNGATIVDQGTNSYLQIPLNGNANTMAWYSEYGGEFNLYGKSLEVVHATKGQISPLFNIGVAYRIDTRLSQDSGVTGFTSPDRRFVFRFMVNGIKILDRRPDATADKPWSISFGVEHEQGFGANPVPGGTTLLIRGDINLLKLINPGAGS